MVIFRLSSNASALMFRMRCSAFSGLWKLIATILRVLKRFVICEMVDVEVLSSVLHAAFLKSVLATFICLFGVC